MKKTHLLVAFFMLSTTFNAQNLFQSGSNVGIGTSSPSAYLEIYTPVLAQGVYNTQKWSSGNPGYELKLQTVWNGSGINQEFIQRYNGIDYKALAFFAGNVGIGNSSPEVPLTVYGVSNFYPRRIGDGDARQFSIRYSFTNPQFENNLYPIVLGTGGGNQPLILDAARIGIGTMNPDSKLAVNGTIHSKEVKVDMEGWSDFVFKKDYSLPTLAEVEKHINEKGHLENIPSEEEVLKNGINLGEMNAKLLQKIEELTLYMIEMKKENIEMKNKQSELENTITELKTKMKK